MKKGYISLFTFVLALTLNGQGPEGPHIELLSPRGAASIPTPLGMYGALSDGIPRHMHFVENDSAISNCLDTIRVRLYSVNGIDWETLSIGLLLQYGGELIYPNPLDTSRDGTGYSTMWGWNYLRDLEECLYHYPDENREARLESLRRQRLLYTTLIDTLSDTCWTITIIPAARETQEPVYVPRCLIDHDRMLNCYWFSFSWYLARLLESFTDPPYPSYEGPCYYNALSDPSSPGFGLTHTTNGEYCGFLGSSLLVCSVKDTLGNPWYGYAEHREIWIDYSGPVASNPLPEPGDTALTAQPIIELTILDSVTLAPRFYGPDGSSCWCKANNCRDSLGNFLAPPWCDVPYTTFGKVDSTSIRLSINGREIAYGDPGLYWERDTINLPYLINLINARLRINTAEAGISFSPGDTVQVCLLEATDVVRGGYGPNHLGRYRDWTHPDTPIPYCWEFYISPTAVPEKQTTPTDISLEVSPNPFNAETRIMVNLPETGLAELAIFNLNGQKVKMLFSGKLKEGKHLFVWDGNDGQGLPLPLRAVSSSPLPRPCLLASLHAVWRPYDLLL